MVKDEIRTARYSGEDEKKRDMGGGHRFHESTCLAYMLEDEYVHRHQPFPWRFRLSPADKNLARGDGERVTHVNFDYTLNVDYTPRLLIPYLEAGVGFIVT